MIDIADVVEAQPNRHGLQQEAHRQQKLNVSAFSFSVLLFDFVCVFFLPRNCGA